MEADWNGRSFETALDSSTLETVQHGALRSQYRGVAMLKSPFDIGIYLQLFSRIEPRTVLEIGAKHGGSALFFADLMTAGGVDGRVLAVDIDPLVAFDDERIEIVRADAQRLGGTRAEELLRDDPPRPLVVIEDSAHDYDTTLAVMRFVAPYLRPGDYLVVEDGIVAQMPHERYRAYEDGPNRAVRAFLSERDDFEIDTELCDFYGYNVTWSPNGFLRRR